MKGFIEVCALEINENEKTLVNIKDISIVVNLKQENVMCSGKITERKVITNSIIILNNISYRCIETYEDIVKKIEEAQWQKKKQARYLLYIVLPV